MKYPTIMTTDSAGADLHSKKEYIIEPGGSAIISTGYHYDIPRPSRVMGRSGLAFKYGIVAFNGLIDADYREEVKVKLFNLGKVPFVINEGDRIAQLVVLSSVETSEWFPSREESRESGFGSTGR